MISLWIAFCAVPAFKCTMPIVTLSSETSPLHAPSSPSANRLSRARWRDLRFWIGVLLVVSAVLVGARLVAAADQTIEVWQVTRDLPAGSPLDAGSVSVVRVHFDADATQERYLSADASLPDDASVTRDLGSGELLPVDAVTDGPGKTSLELPLVVPAAGFPSNLSAGDLVEVWALQSDADGQRDPLQVLDEVRVVAVSSTDFATATSDRSVVVALPDAEQSQRVLDGLADRSIVLLRLGG